MKLLCIRTDKPESEIYLFEGEDRLLSYKWEAQRDLAKNLLSVIEEQMNLVEMQLGDVDGIAVYKGPGSFTGLRIGITTANALAYSLDIPVVSETGEDWTVKAYTRIQKGENEETSMPHYGAEANITTPKK